MITVCLNKAEFEYDIHSLVKAFYAREDVKVFADREKITKLEQGNTPLFHMEILFRGEGTVEIALYLPPKGQGAMGQEGIAYGDGGYKLEVQRLVETD